jgi:hypothetical protein
VAGEFRREIAMRACVFGAPMRFELKLVALAEPECDEPRPWERPGAVRRDCEPHRGTGLALLSKVAVWCGCLSFLCAVPAILGIPVGFVTVQLANRDLARMAEGQLDPGGRDQTAAAFQRAEKGVVLSILGLFVCPLVWICVSFMLIAVFCTR